MWNMAIGVLGGLGVFLYGMRVMSRGLESSSGERMQRWLQALTKNRFAAVLTGLSVTCLIQSSSATTVMLVSAVHAGLLNLTQAAGVIMGANIGTTLTGWIVALLGFKLKITSFALPAVALGVILIFLGPGRKRALWGEILVGFGLLFIGLDFMKDAVSPLKDKPEIKQWLGYYSASGGIGSIFLAIGVGTLITVMIQSSSATMALTMALAAEGVIDFPTAAALVLGENIGTTITANLAAIRTEITARRTARLHFLFNIFGVLWAVFLFTPFTSLIEWGVPGNSADIRNIPSHMAAFHTTFNVINTLIFLPFIHSLVALVVRLVPGKEQEEEERHILYLDAGIINTPFMALSAVRQELKVMTQRVLFMFDEVMKLFDQPEKEAKEEVKLIEKYENIVDNLERDIAIYLVEVSQNEISVQASREINASMNIAHNLEKIADHCESLLRLLRRKYDMKLSFSEAAVAEVHQIAEEVKKFLLLIQENVISFGKSILEKAREFENRVDDLRTELRKNHTQRLAEGKCEVQAGLIFMDMITSFEKMGDHSYNIAEYVSGKKI